MERMEQKVKVKMIEIVRQLVSVSVIEEEMWIDLVEERVVVFEVEWTVFEEKSVARLLHRYLL